MSELKEKLHSLGFDYSVNSFKKAITEDNNAAIDLFIQGNILQKIKSYESILLHCLKSDSIFVFDILADKMEIRSFPGEILLSLITKVYEINDAIMYLSSMIENKGDAEKTDSNQG